MDCENCRKLQAEIENLRRRHAEEIRDLEREARDIAAEERWRGRAEREDVPYGTY